MSRAALLDAEVVELLADEPELLAVADAVAATQRPPARGRLPLARRLAVVAGLVVVGALVTFTLPEREGRSGVVSHALAALGAGPVLHATIETRLRSATVVDLATGARRRPTVTIEYWYDAERGLFRTVVRQDGAVTREVLHTRGGVTASAGRVPRVGAAPTLDPALQAFATGYREALRGGRVRLVGDAEIAGRDAVWLEVETGGVRERVAIDGETSAPLVVVPLGADGRPGLTWRVLRIETTPRSAADFTRPVRQPPTPFRGDVRASTPISSSAAAALPWETVWLGERWRGLRLVAFERQTVTRGYLPGDRVATGRSVGLRLRYATEGRRTFVELTEAPRPEPAYGFTAGRATVTGNPVPAEGSAELVAIGSGSSPRCLAQLRSGGAYVSVWASSADLCLAAARDLRAIAG